MTNPTELIQLYVLLSYEKLQRATISQRQRPIEASLRTRLLVWRFLKKIESEPIVCEQELFTNSHSNSLDNNNSWIVDFNTDCDDNGGVDMDIDSELITVLGNSEENNNSSCENMNIDQTTDMTALLKRAIGAERRQKASMDRYSMNENQNTLDAQSSSESNSEQFFHDLCTELTTTTASLVSSSTTNALNYSTSSEQLCSSN